MESLWPQFEELNIEKNESISILREQARALKKQTNNEVNATFSKITYKKVVKESTGAIELLSSLVKSIDEEETDPELGGKEDANEFFNVSKYKFEIFNEKYRFRLFILNYSELFPISLDVDEGIRSDITYKNLNKINSNEELKRVLKEIFASKKVRTVICGMMQKYAD